MEALKLVILLTLVVSLAIRGSAGELNGLLFPNLSIFTKYFLVCDKLLLELCQMILYLSHHGCT